MKSPPKVGKIPYLKSIETEAGVYSIDRFVFNFRMTRELWEDFRLSVDLWALKLRLRDCEYFTAKRYGTEVKVFQYFSLHIETWEGYPNKSRPENCYCVRLDYNPNKLLEPEQEMLGKMMAGLGKNNDKFVFDLSRVDFAFDVPVPIEKIYVLSRKTESHVVTTRYYGKAGSSGMLRVYDKREEMKRNHIELGQDWTRLEWEQRGGKDLQFKFDCFCTADFGGLQYPASVIPYINPGDINKALKGISKNTRTKYKNLFTPYPFDAANFRHLLDEYMDEYGIRSNRWNYSIDHSIGFLEQWEDDYGTPFEDTPLTFTIPPSLVTLRVDDEDED